MRYLMLALVSLSLLACQSGAPVEEQVTVGHKMSVAPNSIHDVAVSVEFVLHGEQVLNHPIIVESFMNAVSDWACNVPIRPTVFIQERGDHTSSRYGTIEVIIDDLQSPAYNLSFGIVGIWLESASRLMLDSDYLENNPEVAFSVALHELGHVFGLPHIVDHDDFAVTGTLVLSSEQDATGYVMYPTVNSKTPQGILSQIEIDLAKQQVMLFITNPIFMRIDECHLTAKTD